MVTNRMCAVNPHPESGSVRYGRFAKLGAAEYHQPPDAGGRFTGVGGGGYRQERYAKLLRKCFLL